MTENKKMKNKQVRREIRIINHADVENLEGTLLDVLSRRGEADAYAYGKKLRESNVDPKPNDFGIIRHYPSANLKILYASNLVCLKTAERIGEGYYGNNFFRPQDHLEEARDLNLINLRGIVNNGVYMSSSGSLGWETGIGGRVWGSHSVTNADILIGITDAATVEAVYKNLTHKPLDNFHAYLRGFSFRMVENGKRELPYGFESFTLENFALT